MDPHTHTHQDAIAITAFGPSAIVRLVFGIILAAGLLSACGEVSRAADPAVSAHGFDAQPVQRCLNMAAAFEAPPDEHWGYDFREADFARVRAAGFDTIRLPVRWSAYTGPAPHHTINPDFAAEVEQRVDQALAAGLQVILNVHFFEDFNQRPEAEEAELRAIWRQLAARFADLDDRLIFELINEPHFDDMPDGRDLDYSSAYGIALMNRVNAGLVAMIRETQPDRWLVLGSSQWGSHYPLTDGMDGVRLDPDFDPRVMTTFHFYEPMEFTHQNMAFIDYPPYPRTWGSPRDKAKLRSVFEGVARYRAREGKNMPVLLGEFGVGNATPPDQKADYLETMRRESERHGIGWCAFEFGGPNFGLFDTNANAWEPDMLDALMRD